jgi:hydrogen peroxide-dependent heme synthase
MSTSATEPVAAIEPPQTVEGWYVLHEAFHLDWPRWRALSTDQRHTAIDGLLGWLRRDAGSGAGDSAGDSAAYAVVGQKADLLFLHYRPTIAHLHQAQTARQRLAIAAYCRDAGSFVSVTEASLYEAGAHARAALQRQGLSPSDPGYADALERETATARRGLEQRLRQPIPVRSHLCWYPMSKRRGEQHNWYAMTLDQRRHLMRGHGQLGQLFRDQVTQVVSGAIGLDDWEWAVDLHADDPLTFKKLVTAMRYDGASAHYAEFGPFWIGLRQDDEGLRRLLS